jgi:hypothetical protein
VPVIEKGMANRAAEGIALPAPTPPKSASAHRSEPSSLIIQSQVALRCRGRGAGWSESSSLPFRLLFA